MTRSEAYILLEAEETDSFVDIRHKYRALMHIHHPDSSGDGIKNHEMAGKLNEAFEIIKREGISKKKVSAGDFGISENLKAFCKRKLYMEDTLFGDDIVVDTGGYGRFYWEPDMESFNMLLKSVSEAAEKLLDDHCGGLSENNENYLRIKTKLLHLLLQQFIDPYECIDALFPKKEETEDGIHVFTVRCQIKPDDARILKKTDVKTCNVIAEGSKLYATAEGKTIGQVMFREDWLYYLITPLFLQGAAESVLDVLQNVGGRKAYIKADLKLRVNMGKKRDVTENINEEIRKTLKSI